MVVQHKKSSRSKDNRQIRRRKELDLLKEINHRVRELDLQSSFNSFSELPLTQQTQLGLKAAHYIRLTDVQKKCIPCALKGQDILGAARTGSGKTLSFLVPVLELLVRKKWTVQDGLGALIISPTRELAMQIFEVLRKIGGNHAFSAGLVIGGKDLQTERTRLNRMNILVATPGRLLQHMDQTVGFDVEHLQMLVLDEADRILDMGFQKTIDAIVENLPPSRQTLLFSATQTKSVKDLARLSLQSPTYISVDEASEYSTPKNLQQYAVYVDLPEKLDSLYGFVKTHLKTKCLVFLSSCKQVRFVFECFRQLQPGVPLMHLHGKQKQNTRADVSTRFSKAKHAFLFCTDIVARGLDFAAVDWVLQVDAPEDADTYIHRVGRTARFDREGKALLFLLPSEEKFIERLENKRVPIDLLNIKNSKKQSIKSQLAHFCFQDSELKSLGQKAFVSYLRSLYVQKDKQVFRMDDLPIEEYATSLGLPGAPSVKFLRKASAKPMHNPETSHSSESEDESVAQDEGRVADDPKGEPVQASNNAPGEEEDDDFITMKRTDHGLDELQQSESDMKAIEESSRFSSKRKQLEALSRKKMLKYKPNPEKLVFDEQGNAHAIYEFEDEEKFKKAGDADQQIQKFVQEQQAELASRDIADKSEAKEKRKAKRRRMQEHLRQSEIGSDEEAGVELAPPEEDDGMDETESSRTKRPRKWFEKPEQESGNIQAGQVDSIDDQEALAMQLLNPK